MEFKDLGLSGPTIQAIEELGIKHPTTVQSDVIPAVLDGKDVFAIAPQRSGKTYSYVLPLIDVIAKTKNQNILILTADSWQANNVSDCFAVFNKYHENDDSEDSSNVIIATPDLVLELEGEQKIDLSNINLLVVDDINLIKKKHQLSNLEQILEKLPADKQNIVFTNRRSKETQSILDKILKTPTEIKVDKTKEDEALSAHETEQQSPKTESQSESFYSFKQASIDAESLKMAEKYKVFGDKTPRFLLIKGELKHK